jgi:hypothetical protein
MDRRLSTYRMVDYSWGTTPGNHVKAVSLLTPPPPMGLHSTSRLAVGFLTRRPLSRGSAT